MYIYESVAGDFYIIYICSTILSHVTTGGGVDTYIHIHLYIHIHMYIYESIAEDLYIRYMFSTIFSHVTAGGGAHS